MGRLRLNEHHLAEGGSRHVAEEAMSLLFILAHFSAARLRMSLELRQTTVKEDWLVPEVDRGCSHAAELAGAVGKCKRCDHPISPLMVVTCGPTSSIIPIDSWTNRHPGLKGSSPR
jgi:hypothetical protein